MTSDAIIDALQRQKQQLEENLPQLLAQCRNDNDRLALTGAYTRATQQWNDAVNQALRTNNPLPDVLVGDLSNLQDEIMRMIARADDLGVVLNKIATGIAIGSKILTLIR